MYGIVGFMSAGGLGDLAQVVEGLEVPVCAEGIVEARRVLDVLGAKVAAAEADFERAGGPEVEGYGSLAAFERHRCGLSAHESRRAARRAARVGAWPALGEAWQSGVLSGAQVDAVVGLVPDRHVERFAEVAAETVAILAPLGLHETRVALRHWVERADALAEAEAAETGVEAEPPEPTRELFVSRSLDEVAYVRGVLDGDAAAYVEAALGAAARPDAEGERRSPGQRRADALVEVCRFYLDHAGCGRGRPNERLTVLVELTGVFAAVLRGAGVRTPTELAAFFDTHPGLGILERGLFLDAFDGHTTMARTLDGNPISAELVAAIASSGTLERLLTVEGRVLDLGRSVRTFTPAQRRAVLARDGGCRVAGCGAGPERCDIHHVTPWETGGTTDLTNAVAKCRRCHHDHHRHHARDRLDLDGTYTVTSRDGATHTTRPPRWRPVELPLPTSPTTNDPPAPPPGPAPSAPRPSPPRRRTRPRCDCPCPHHPDHPTLAEILRHRATVLDHLLDLRAS